MTSCKHHNSQSNYQWSKYGFIYTNYQVYKYITILCMTKSNFKQAVVNLKSTWIFKPTILGQTLIWIGSSHFFIQQENFSEFEAFFLVSNVLIISLCHVLQWECLYHWLYFPFILHLFYFLDLWMYLLLSIEHAQWVILDTICMFKFVNIFLDEAFQKVD